LIRTIRKFGSILWISQSSIHELCAGAQEMLTNGDRAHMVAGKPLLDTGCDHETVNAAHQAPP
jgi:hypothetical protein